MELFLWLLQILVEKQAGEHGAILTSTDLDTMLGFIIILLRSALAG